MMCEFMSDDVVRPNALDNLPPLPVVEYENMIHQLGATAAPELQAKTALDGAIASGSMEKLQVVLQQIRQHIPGQAIVLVMHALRSVGRQGNLAMMQFLLEQIAGCDMRQMFDLMKYALDGTASQHNPGVMDFLLGAVQKAFHASHPQLFLELVQHGFNAVAKHGNLGLLKFLMDHAAAAALPINYDDVFGHASAAGQAESLLREAIKGGALYENVTLMLLQSVRNLPENNDSGLGSRQSLKTAAKVQVVKSYKQKDPALFNKLMLAIKNYFPEEIAHAQGAPANDVAM